LTASLKSPKVSPPPKVGHGAIGRQRSTRRSKPAELTSNYSPNERLAEMSAATLTCRMLRHAWPRSGPVLFETPRRNGAVERELRMECTGGCGTIRVEQVTSRGDGRISRVGQVHYKYLPGYLIVAGKRFEPTPDPVDRDEIRYAALSLMYPGTKW